MHPTATIRLLHLVVRKVYLVSQEMSVDMISGIVARALADAIIIKTIAVGR